MSKKRLTVGLIANIIAILALGFGLVIALTPVFGPVSIVPTIYQYPVIVGIYLAIVSILGFIFELRCYAGKKMPKAIAALRLIGVVAGLIGLVILIADLAAHHGNWETLYGWKNSLWIVVVGPVAATVAIIAENKPRLKWPFAFLGIILPAVYLVAMFALYKITGNVEFRTYSFIDVTVETLRHALMWAALIAAAFFWAFAIIMFRRLGEAPEEQPAVEEQPKEEQGEEAEVAAEENPEASPEGAQEQPERTIVFLKRRKPRVYRILFHPCGKWVVRSENSKKIIKIVDSRDEGIEYAKGLIEARGLKAKVTEVTK